MSAGKSARRGHFTEQRAMMRPHPRVSQPGPQPAYRRFPSQKVRHTFPVPDGWPAGKRSVGVSTHGHVAARAPLPESDSDEEENTQEANTRAGDGLTLQWERRRRPASPGRLASPPSSRGGPRPPSRAVFRAAPSPRTGTFQSPSTFRPHTHDGQMGLRRGGPSFVQSSVYTITSALSSGTLPFADSPWSHTWSSVTTCSSKRAMMHTSSSKLRGYAAALLDAARLAARASALPYPAAPYPAAF